MISGGLCSGNEIMNRNNNIGRGCTTLGRHVFPSKMFLDKISKGFNFSMYIAKYFGQQKVFENETVRNLLSV